MTKLTTPITVGKQYLRRDGIIVTATTPAVDDDHIMVVRQGNEGGYTVLRATGACVWRSADIDPADIVADYPELALTLPVRINRQYISRGGTVVTAGNFTNDPNTVRVYINAGTSYVVHAATGALAGTGAPSMSDLVADYPGVAKTATETKPQGHPHAARMTEYAEDALSNPEPWALWEVRNPGGPWAPMGPTLSWAERAEYRRKPKLINVGGALVHPDLLLASRNEIEALFAAADKP